MAIGSRICGNFYVKTGGGNDEITSKRLNEIDAAFNADKTKASGQLIYDDTLGPLVFNLQEVVADLDQIRSYISPLPVDSGGTGTTATAYCSLTANVTGTLPVGSGGTGATSFTSNSILTGNTTGAIQAEATLQYNSSKLLLGADDDTVEIIQRISHSDDDGGELHILAGAGGGTDKDGGDLYLSPGSHTNMGTPGRIIFKAGEKSGSGGNTPQGLGDIAFVDGDSVSGGGSFDLKAGVFRGGNIGSTQTDASTGLTFIPITATEWIGNVVEAGKNFMGVGGYMVQTPGYAPWYSANPLSAFCEKVIPRGYQTVSAVLYGTNAGGSGNESQFHAVETSIIANTQITRCSNTDWGTTAGFTAAVVGDTNKCITIYVTLESKSDVIYGGKIFIAKV